MRVRWKTLQSWSAATDDLRGLADMLGVYNSVDTAAVGDRNEVRSVYWRLQDAISLES